MATKTTVIAHEKSGGNVFADLGLPHPNRELLKARLTLQIYRIIKARHLPQAQARAILGIRQPQVSLLMRNRSGSFSVERLMDFLTALGHDVEVCVTPTRKERGQPPAVHAPHESRHGDRRRASLGHAGTRHLQEHPPSHETEGRTMRNHDQELARLRARVENLEEVCAEAYQLAGAVGAPVRILDMLWAAADGKMVNVESILPVSADECEEIVTLHRQLDEVRRIVAIGPAAAELGRVGGSRTSAAKRRAARANGRKGGRPRTAA